MEVLPRFLNLAMSRGRASTNQTFFAGEVAFAFCHDAHALVTLYVQFLCSDWSKFDRWGHAENFCSILNLVYFDSWSWQSFVSTCDVFNCLLPLDWNSTVISSLLLFMASLFIGFLVEKYVACQSRKSDFGWHHFRFHLAWCVRGLQSLKRYWPYLITFRSCIANGKPEKLLYLMFFLCVYNSMKLSVVYAGI